MSEVIHGACLCGEIAFDVQPSYQYGQRRAMGICHCTRCQRWSGGSCLPFVVVAPERFKVTKGQELMAHYRDENSELRTFCRRCGSNVYQDTGSTYYVAAGVLQNLILTPTFHIHVADQATWEEIDDDLPQFAEMPIARTSGHDRRTPCTHS